MRTSKCEDFGLCRQSSRSPGVSRICYWECILHMTGQIPRITIGWICIGLASDIPSEQELKFVFMTSQLVHQFFAHAASGNYESIFRIVVSRKTVDEFLKVLVLQSPGRYRYRYSVRDIILKATIFPWGKESIDRLRSGVHIDLISFCDRRGR